MLHAHESVHVLYGSNEVAVWTIVASLLTFASSFVLGFAAFRNGRKATKIAQAASDRDEDHRLDEAKVRAQNARDAVALSVLKALSAIEVLRTGTLTTYADGRSSVEQRKVSLVLDANAKLTLYTSRTAEVLMVDWYENQITHLDLLDRFEDDDSPTRKREFDRTLLAAKEGITAWASHQTTAAELLYLA